MAGGKKTYGKNKGHKAQQKAIRQERAFMDAVQDSHMETKNSENVTAGSSKDVAMVDVESKEDVTAGSSKDGATADVQSKEDVDMVDADQQQKDPNASDPEPGEITPKASAKEKRSTRKTADKLESGEVTPKAPAWGKGVRISDILNPAPEPDSVLQHDYPAIVNTLLAGQGGTQQAPHQTRSVTKATTQQIGLGKQGLFDPAAIIRQRAHVKSKGPLEVGNPEESGSNKDEGNLSSSLSSLTSVDSDATLRPKTPVPVFKPRVLDYTDVFNSLNTSYINQIIAFWRRKKKMSYRLSVPATGVPATSTSNTFPRWKELPDKVRVRILMYVTREDSRIKPTDSARSPWNSHWHNYEIPDCPPKDLLVGVGNKQFSNDVAAAYYGGNVFFLENPIKTHRFLKRIGPVNIQNLRWVVLMMDGGETVGGAGFTVPGISLHKISAGNLNLLSKNKALDHLVVKQKGGRPRNKPRIDGSKLTENDLDEFDPLFDFGDGKYKFYPSSILYPGKWANSVITALMKFRNVAQLDINLGDMAGQHWEDALYEIMRSDIDDMPPVALAILAAWKKRQDWDKIKGNDPFKIQW